MELDLLLREARKAQLQEFYVRWFPGEELVGLREKLVERLRAAMTDPQKVRARFDRLARSARDFLGSLLSREGFRGTLAQVRADRRGRSIEDFEVESLVRLLLDDGFIAAENQPGPDGGWREVYHIPVEIGEALKRTVDLEAREVSKMLSLRDLLGPEGPERGIEELTVSESVEGRLAQIPDPVLAGLARLALKEYCGILTPSRRQQRGDSAAAVGDMDGKGEGAAMERLHRPAWRESLEALHLGTTGVISLRDFGIELEEEGLVIFQELVLESSLAEAQEGPGELDREVSLGVDLLIDLDRILEIVHMENVEVTREGMVFKKTEERIGPLLISPRYPELFQGDPVHGLFSLCRRLNFFEQDGARLRCDPLRRRGWGAKRPLAKVREIYHLYQGENRGEHWSFHQGALREILLALLTGLPAGRWLDGRALLNAVLATYLLSLKERGVDAEFRRRWNEDFQHERLMVPLEKLVQDLAFWIIHRLGPLGIVDLGYRGGRFQGLRLSVLGAQFFGLPQQGEEPGQLIVNPDFEVLLFPGGEREAELSLALSHFADRTASDRVKRYTITAESVKRGVIAGMDTRAILGLLESNAKHPLPANVRYSVRQWGDGVEPIQRQRALLLRARTRQGADRLSAVLEANGVSCERFGENGLVLQAPRGERALRDLREVLRDQGLYLE